MDTAVLSLDKEQAKRLLGYIQEYRRYLLMQTPSTDRNTMQRVLQALQGRLIQNSQEARQNVLAFRLQCQEAHTLQTMVIDLCKLKAQQFQTEQIARSIIDLVGLKAALANLYPLEPRTYFTQRLS